MRRLVAHLKYSSLSVTGHGLALMCICGLRNVIQGKVVVVTAVILSLPAVAVGVLSMIMDTWADAFIYGVIGLLIVTALSLLISSFRTLLGF